MKRIVVALTQKAARDPAGGNPARAIQEEGLMVVQMIVLGSVSAVVGFLAGCYFSEQFWHNHLVKLGYATWDHDGDGKPDWHLIKRCAHCDQQYAPEEEKEVQP